MFLYLFDIQLQYLSLKNMNKAIVGILTAAISIAVLLSSTSTFAPDTVNGQWNSWKLQNLLEVTPETEVYRNAIFSSNFDFISKHNAKSDKSYEMTTNQFSHLTTEEFDQLFSSKKNRNIQQEFLGERVTVREVLPNDIDWERQGKISPVKSQGQCDAGYAFCSNSLAESFALFNKTTINLSQQNVVDCSKDYTTFGCSSGSRSGTLKFLQEKGVATQAKYPWVGTQQTCKNAASQYKLTQNLVTANGCNQLQSQLLTSPLTVAVNTTNWQFYRSGVLENCGSEVNHDILLVGYTGTSWKLKNSWGVRWGEYGYIRIRNGDTCGICSKPGFGFKV